jgi:hypothetical protein
MGIQEATHCDNLIKKVEYVVVTTTMCQAIWLHRVLGDLQQGQEGPTLVYCDNISTISLSKAY